MTPHHFLHGGGVSQEALLHQQNQDQALDPVQVQRHGNQRRLLGAGGGAWRRAASATLTRDRPGCARRVSSVSALMDVSLVRRLEAEVKRLLPLRSVLAV